MTYANTVIKKCPDTLELEKQYLRAATDHKCRVQTAGHVNHCPSCRQELQEINGIYKFTVKELNTPVSGKVLDFACKISGREVQKEYFFCIPALKKTLSNSRAFLIKMLLTENSAMNKTFAGLKSDKLPVSALGMRAIADQSLQNVCLYFETKKPVDFIKYSISIPGLVEHVRLSGNGTAILPFLKIQDLHNKIIYFTGKEKIFKKSLIKLFQQYLSEKPEQPF